jgi:hypothetical protein
VEINNMILVPDADDPTAAEPVLLHMEPEGSCLMVSIEKGEKKADIFIWRDENGRVWGRMTSAAEDAKGEVGKEVELIGGDPNPKPEAVVAEAAEVVMQMPAEVATAVQPEAELPPRPPEEIPEGEEIPF